MSQISFQYKAINACGARTRGVMHAPSRDEAYRRIVASGLRPVHIRNQSARGGFRRRISLKDISHLTYQFSVLMEARVPIADGLRSIGEQEPNQRLRAVITDVAGRIESGETITASLEPHRAVFGDIYVETLRAAEQSGNMIEVLSHLATMLDQQYEMRKQVKGAMLYPICVISALLIAVIFLVLVVVPKFATMFAARGVDLPMLTEALLATSLFCKSWWFLILGGLLGGLLALRKAWATPSWRRRIDRTLHRVPFLRDLLIGTGVSRFAHILGLSLRSGLNLLDAISMAGTASGRPLLVADAERMQKQVNQGGRLADVLLACEYIPGFARRMMTAGEEAGELPKMCQIVARHYDREVSHLAKNIATIIEPVMIVGLAIVVLIISLAIFLPMWNMAVVIG